MCLSVSVVSKLVEVSVRVDYAHRFVVLVVFIPATAVVVAIRSTIRGVPLRLERVISILTKEVLKLAEASAASPSSEETSWVLKVRWPFPIKAHKKHGKKSGNENAMGPASQVKPLAARGWDDLPIRVIVVVSLVLWLHIVAVGSADVAMAMTKVVIEIAE